MHWKKVKLCGPIERRFGRFSEFPRGPLRTLDSAILFRPQEIKTGIYTVRTVLDSGTSAADMTDLPSL